MRKWLCKMLEACIERRKTEEEEELEALVREVRKASEQLNAAMTELRKRKGVSISLWVGYFSGNIRERFYYPIKISDIRIVRREIHEI